MFEYCKHTEYEVKWSLKHVNWRTINFTWSHNNLEFNSQVIKNDWSSKHDMQVFKKMKTVVCPSYLFFDRKQTTFFVPKFAKFTKQQTSRHWDVSYVSAISNAAVGQGLWPTGLALHFLVVVLDTQLAFATTNICLTKINYLLILYERYQQHIA